MNKYEKFNDIFQEMEHRVYELESGWVIFNCIAESPFLQTLKEKTKNGIEKHNAEWRMDILLGYIQDSAFYRIVLILCSFIDLVNKLKQQVRQPEDGETDKAKELREKIEVFIVDYEKSKELVQFRNKYIAHNGFLELEETPRYGEVRKLSEQITSFWNSIKGEQIKINGDTSTSKKLPVHKDTLDSMLNCLQNNISAQLEQDHHRRIEAQKKKWGIQ